MRILLDTHVFLWLRTAPDKISDKVLSAYYDMENDVFLSIASIWEMQIKQQMGKLDRQIPIRHLIEEQCINNGLQLMPIEPSHIYALADLPFHHKDPFDRLILTQSILENIALSSADKIFSQYAINIFW